MKNLKDIYTSILKHATNHITKNATAHPMVYFNTQRQIIEAVYCYPEWKVEDQRYQHKHLNIYLHQPFLVFHYFIMFSKIFIQIKPFFVLYFPIELFLPLMATFKKIQIFFIKPMILLNNTIFHPRHSFRQRIIHTSTIILALSKIFLF